jgi:hypothetical protein
MEVKEDSRVSLELSSEMNHQLIKCKGGSLLSSRDLKTEPTLLALLLPPWRPHSPTPTHPAFLHPDLSVCPNPLLRPV